MVQSKIHSLFGSRQVHFRGTSKPITPFGGLISLVECFDKICLTNAKQEVMQFRLNSPNAIPPGHTLTAFFFPLIVGAIHFAHSDRLRHSNLAAVGPGNRRWRGRLYVFWRLLGPPNNRMRPSHQSWLTAEQGAEFQNLNLQETGERGIASSTLEFRINKSTSPRLWGEGEEAGSRKIGRVFGLCGFRDGPRVKPTPKAGAPRGWCPPRS
jgi:hypothetical protein